jgi:predicted MarR family transcription regulator
VGTILKWKGELVEVSWYGEGKEITMTPIGAKPCKKCGEIKRYHILEHSPLFQENAEPVETLTSK